MRRIVALDFAPLDQLVVEDGPDLLPAADQVVVAVRAAGVNYVDALLVQGRYQIKPPLPFSPGSEVAGEVVAVGAEVEGVTTGETILVLGAGGGVGLATVDVARGLGLHAIAAASTDEKLAAARAAGAEHTIDYEADDLKIRARELSVGGVDVVVDPVGGPYAEQALRALTVGGRFLVIGFASGEIPRLPANHVLLNNRTVVGVDWGAWAMHNPDDNRSLTAELMAAVESGRLDPPEPTVYPLDKAADALADLEGRRVAGKVVLVP